MFGKEDNNDQDGKDKGNDDNDNSDDGNDNDDNDCKSCNSYGQLLCGMLQVPSAVHTLHTHSIASYRRSIGAYNIPVATQWLVQRLCYSLV